jgi:hypothetical protein
VSTPVCIRITKDKSLAAVPVKGKTEIGGSSDVAQEVLCFVPVRITPFADESRENTSRLRQVGSGDSRGVENGADHLRIKQMISNGMFLIGSRDRSKASR